MSATRLSKGVITKPTRPFSSSRRGIVRNSFVRIDRKGTGNADIVGGFHLSSRHRTLLSPLVTHRRKPGFNVCGSQLNSDCDVGASDVKERLAVGEEELLSSSGEDSTL
jgi:hypothetical protein